MAAELEIPIATHIIDAREGHVLPSPDGATAIVSDFQMTPYLLDVLSGHRIADLEVPVGFKVEAKVFSRDGSKIAGVAGQKDGRNFILFWAASSGKLLQRAVLPDSAVYVMCMRFSRNGNTLLVGARGLFQYDLHADTLEMLIRDENVPYYVMDIADHPKANILAYVDGVTSYGIHQWAPSEHRDLPSLFQAEIRESKMARVRIQAMTVDYSADGLELAASLGWAPAGTDGWTVVRVDTQSRKVVSTTVVPKGTIKRLRYIGTSKILCAQGDIRSPVDGCFGFLKPGVNDFDSWIDFDTSVTDVVVDPSQKGHVTVGLDDGRLFRWDRADWPESWRRILTQER